MKYVTNSTYVLLIKVRVFSFSITRRENETRTSKKEGAIYEIFY